MLLLLTTLLFAAVQVLGINLDYNNVDNIHANQALIAEGLMDYYDGNDRGGTPGMFQPPYYWWEAGVAWGTMLDYGFYTGNTTYDHIVKEALLHQTGKDWDYMPSNQTTTEGNDDQAFWGVTVMAAAEQNFSNPSKGQPQWLYLAQSVFNTMSARWETGSCGGGLRWQIYPWNTGWTYKNSVGNGALFHIGARLYRYNGNDTYIRWAKKVWDWMEDVQFLDKYFGNKTLSVFDGADMSAECKDVRRLEWTYNSGLMISGCAYLYNATNETVWLDRANFIWNRAKVFFNSTNKIMYEAACQPSNRCNTDQRSFKGIFSRFLGLTCMMAPSMNDEIMEYIQKTSLGVAQSCSGGSDGHTCGQNWFANGWDGVYGLGEQISALDLLNTLLVHQKPPPLSEKTGATSKGDPNAGAQSVSSNDPQTPNALDIETKDKAGAGVITAVVVLLLLGTGIWLLF